MGRPARLKRKYRRRERGTPVRHRLNRGAYGQRVRQAAAVAPTTEVTGIGVLL